MVEVIVVVVEVVAAPIAAVLDVIIFCSIDYIGSCRGGCRSG